MKFKFPVHWWPLVPKKAAALPPSPALPVGSPAESGGGSVGGSAAGPAAGSAAGSAAVRRLAPAWAWLHGWFGHRPSTSVPPSAPVNRLAAEPVAPGAALPALRGLGQWVAVAGLLASGAIVVWVAVSAWDLVSASRGVVAHRFTAPTLATFPVLVRTELLPAHRLNPDLQRALTPNEDRLLRAVQNVAMFENARSEPLLRAAQAAVQAVVAGSPAARALVEPGDIVQQVNGKEAGFVWDVYQFITERPLQLLELTLLRGTETLTLRLSLNAGERFDMSNHGLLFAVPDSVRYIGKTDAVRIADQLRVAYLEPLPGEWRAPYVEGLLGLSHALVSNLSTLQAAAPGSSNYLLSEDLLAWYQRQFNDNLGAHRMGVERLRMRQTEALLQMGWSVLAMAAVALLALARAVRSTWVLR